MRNPWTWLSISKMQTVNQWSYTL